VPYRLYIPSVPVQQCTLTLPIPLLPLCAVRPVHILTACSMVHSNFTYNLLPLRAIRPVQNLSACTTVHYNFTYTSTPPMCRTVCTEPQCLYKVALDIYLYLYSPYVPYRLYRTLVPLQRCTLTLPIPLIPLYAVRHVQNLSACTTVNFTFIYTSTSPMCRTACTEPQCLYNVALYLYLYLYSPYLPYGLYRNSVPVQRCTLPLPIPLLPLCVVLPVRNLSACTTVHFNFTCTSNPLCAVPPVQGLSTCTTVHFTFTYTSTPPMSLTVCTEP